MAKIKDGREIPYFQLENDIVDREDLTIHEKVVYMVLTRYANNATSCFPSYETIAKKSGISRPTAIKAVTSLIDKKLIKKKARKSNNKKENATNLYTIESCVSPSKGDLPPSKGDLPPSKGDLPNKELLKKNYLKNKTVSKIPQETNYNQRKYDDKFYESLYDNL